MSAILAFAATPIGRYAILAGVAILAVGGVALWLYGEGKAAAAAEAAALALERATAAARAKAKVRNTPEDIARDPYNRDRL